MSAPSSAPWCSAPRPPSRRAARAAPCDFVLLPLVIAGAGIVFSIAGTFLVRTKEGGNPQTALNMGTFGACLIMAVLTYPIVKFVAPPTFQLLSVTFRDGAIQTLTETYQATGVFWATIVGLVAGRAHRPAGRVLHGRGQGPSNRVADASETGAATNIIAGLGMGMVSTALPVLVLGAAIIAGLQVRGALRHRPRRSRHAGHHGHPARGGRLRPDRRQRRRPGRNGRPGEGSARSAPTSSTPWATPPPPSARASPSVRPP